MPAPSKTREDYQPGCFTPREIAATYGISESVVWNAMHSGQLKSRINTFVQRMVPPDAVDAWAQGQGLTPRANTPTWMLPDWMKGNA